MSDALDAVTDPPAPGAPGGSSPADPADPTADPAGRRSGLAALWRVSRKGLVILAGSALLLGGVAMLVLPGPGLLVIIAGLSVLAREFVWAERALHAARRRAAAGAEKVKAAAGRRSRTSP